MSAASEPPPTVDEIRGVIEGADRVIGLISNAVIGQPMGLIVVAAAAVMVKAAKESEMPESLLIGMVVALVQALPKGKTDASK